ncbi:MAG: hypothetical protein KatS3mg051_0501 [Anaerolineae bacterium]|nr:MAG: hypothetical protein KatS3mg051_0501 [Anaerolineae bacterium]
MINEAAVKVLRDELAGYTALLLGPGFGREEVTGLFLRELLRPEEEIRHSRAIGFVPTEPAAGRHRLCTNPSAPPGD